MPSPFRTLWFAIALSIAPSLAPGQAQWRVEGGPGPSTVAVGYDQARAELVVLGTDDTWVHDGNRWQRRTSPPTLRNRYETLLAFDEGRRRLVLFGGRPGGGNAVGDTWEWDGAVWTQRQNNPQLATVFGYMTFDASRGRLVRHGMDAQSIWRMWDWDGTTWTQFGTSLYNLRGMVFDHAANRLVGIDDQSYLQWTVTGWQTLVGFIVPQLPLTTLHLAYDRGRQALVLFAGGPQQIDVREWNGSTFAPRQSPTYPPGRNQFHAAYDPSRQRLVVHGGFDSNNYRNYVDTWEWDGSAWSERESPPPLRTTLSGSYSNLAYDQARQRLVLFQSGIFGAWSAGTWEWDGRTWHRMAPLQSPPLTANGPLVYDSLRQRLVLVSSGSATTLLTWSYDGTTWTQLVTTQAPPDRAGHEIAYDEARDRLVLFGSNFTNDTWLFDGTDWQQAAPTASPPVGTGHKLVYDAVRQQCVLFTVSAQTWVWNGSTWAPRTTPAALTSRVGFGMTWDQARQRIALTGGANPNYQPGGYILRPAELWEWNGAAWAARATTGLTQSLSATLVAAGGSLVLFGGGQPLATGTMLRLVEPLAANVSPYGSGCPGSLGDPIVSADFVPYLGHAEFGLQLTSLPPQTPAILAFGFGAGTVALGNGCFQHVSGALAIQFAAGDAGGAARFPVPIPPDPSFVGVRIFVQGAAFDPNGALGGVALSRGLDLTLGH